MGIKSKLFNMILTCVILISIVFQIPIAKAQTDFGEIILTGSDSMTISGNGFCDNITMSDDATLIVEDGSLRIRGIVRLSENARLFIIRSTVRLDPPALNDNTIVLHATGNSVINVKESSTLIFNPQPTATNISYMLLEDYTNFFLVDSIFSGNLPAIINQSIEVASVTAGVYLLSGYSFWYMKNSDVSGKLSFDGMEQTGRWFWCSLHQRSTLTIENTDIELITPSPVPKTLLKPVSGLTTIKNSNILGGTLDGEVTAEIIIDNSSFEYKVDLKDQTNVKISNSTFHGDVTIGLALTLAEVLEPPETYVEIVNSTFEKILKCEANSTTYLENSTIWGFFAKDNATVDAKHTFIQFYANIEDHVNARMEFCEVSRFDIDDTVYLYASHCEKIPVINFYSTGNVPQKKSMDLIETPVDDLQLHSNCTIFCSLDNSKIENLRFYNGVNSTFECINTSVLNLRPRRTGENVTLSFIVVNSSLPNLTEINKNVTIRIYHRLDVFVTLNEMPIDAEVEVKDELQGEWSAKSTLGKATFDLLYKYIHNDTVKITQDYVAEASFLGFSESKNVVLSSSKTISFTWMDNVPPTIYDISYSPKQWNLGKEITISASVKDEGNMVISSVKLFYRIDDGKWSELQMFKIGEDRYETSIPKQGKNCRIAFYISAEDMAENIKDSEEKEFSVGQEENYFYYGGLILIIILVLIVLVIKILRYRKTKRYAMKYEFKRVKG